MAAQAPIPARRYSGLHPLSIDGRALLAFDQKMNLQLIELESRFHQPRRHVYLRLDFADRRPKRRIK